jgi:hypothetical protein
MGRSNVQRDPLINAYKFPVEFYPTPGESPITWTLDWHGMVELLDNLRRESSGKGRPGAFQDATHFQETMIRLIQLCDKTPISATQANLARLLMGAFFHTDNVDNAEHSLRRCFRNYHISLEELKRLARQ